MKTKTSQNQTQLAKAMTIKIGQAARRVREVEGLTQRATAKKLGVSVVHLCNIERNNSAPSQALIDRYRELWGVDLYILAWCLFGDENQLPERVRRPMKALADAWRKELAHKAVLNAPD